MNAEEALRLLQHLIEKLRERSGVASHFAEWHPQAAQDVKDMAVGRAYAFHEAAVELELDLAAVLPVLARLTGNTSDVHHVRDTAEMVMELEQQLAEAEATRRSLEAQRDGILLALKAFVVHFDGDDYDKGLWPLMDTAKAAVLLAESDPERARQP